MINELFKSFDHFETNTLLSKYHIIYVNLCINSIMNMLKLCISSIAISINSFCKLMFLFSHGHHYILTLYSQISLVCLLNVILQFLHLQRLSSSSIFSISLCLKMKRQHFVKMYVAQPPKVISSSSRAHFEVNLVLFHDG